MLSSALLFSLPLLASFVSVAAQNGTTCNSTSLCPTETPCCSEYGYCGSGSFCLGGCDPLSSHTLTSCAPLPLCQNANYTFDDFSRIQQNASVYNGNASEWDWVVNGGNISSDSGAVAMLLTETNGGTRLSATRYFQYGTVTARMKTGRWDGVVTAFITMSSIKDEIDWEMTNNSNPTTAQSNYFWQGYVPTPTNGETHGNLNDTYSNWHDYTIDWQPTALTWLIDNQVVRVLNKSDTLDSNGVYHYPSTPAQVQLSLWPAGISSSPEGEIQWSGGTINWQDPDYVSAGHFYAIVSSVQIQCSNPQAPPAGTDGYVYGSNSTALTPSILFTNASTLINAASSMRAGAGLVLGWPVVMSALALVSALCFI